MRKNVRYFDAESAEVKEIKEKAVQEIKNIRKKMKEKRICKIRRFIYNRLSGMLDSSL